METEEGRKEVVVGSVSKGKKQWGYVSGVES
jgi:hypothetical protein